MGISKLLKQAAPLLLKANSKLDGKKTLSGLVLTIAGVGFVLADDTRDLGFQTLYVGIPLFIGGIVHKVFKRKNGGQDVR
jgi:uncharacterized membrane protein HdeD (DUF308 family)